MVTIDLMGPLASSLDRGYTLPASWYTNPAMFEAEKDCIFRRCWQYAGLTEQVRHHGEFFTCQAGEVPIVVVRDVDGDLRAFVNVCRHRGSILIPEERGCRKSIQCHYHAWTYGLDGTLRAAPGEKGEAGFDRSEFSLLPVRIDTWGPFIFVNPDRDAPPLYEVLGDLPDLVAETGLKLDDIRLRRRDTYDMAANWKVVVDNYLECYHCPTAHPGFRTSSISINTSSGSTSTFRRRAVRPRRPPEGATREGYTPSGPAWKTDSMSTSGRTSW